MEKRGNGVLSKGKGKGVKLSHWAELDYIQEKRRERSNLVKKRKRENAGPFKKFKTEQEVHHLSVMCD